MTRSRQPFQRCRQLVRCLRLMRLLDTARSVNLSWLASQLRVSTRTIRRDLIALDAAGISVPGIVGRHKDMAA